MAILHRPAALAALASLSLMLTLGAAATANAQVTPAPIGTASPSPSSQLEAASPAPIPTPINPPENTLVTQRVRDAFLAWQGGRVDRKTYSPYAGGTYEHAYVAIVSPVLAIGTPQTVTYQTATLLLGDVVYRYDVTGTSGDVISILYALDQDGRTDGIVFTPLIFRASSKTQ